jgi:CRISPR/Cas system CSM-associated protein Csm2 small subunit
MKIQKLLLKRNQRNRKQRKNDYKNIFIQLSCFKFKYCMLYYRNKKIILGEHFSMF